MEHTVDSHTIPPIRLRRPAALAQPLTVRKLCAGRSRTNAIYVQLLTHNGENVAEISLWRLEVARGMRPTTNSFTHAIARLSELTAALVNVHRRACELRLVFRRDARR
jgi:hypothetical protein